MKKIFGVLVLVLAFLVFDNVIRSRTEDRMVELARNAAPANAATSVRIEEHAFSFRGHRLFTSPFLPRLVTTGGFRRVVVTYRGGTSGHVAFDTLRVTLNDPKLDRALFGRSKIEIKGLDSAEFALRVSPTRLNSELVTNVVSISPEGKMTVLRNGQQVPATVDVENGVLVFRADGAEFARRDFKSIYFPCDPTAKLESGGIALTCTSHDVPAFIKRVVLP
jgi:hypothetical protein